MNKLFTKLAAGFIGLTMVASVGAVIGSKALEKNAVEANAAPAGAITDYTKIVAGDYYIGSTTSSTDYYLSVDGSATSASIAGTAVTDKNSATIFTFAGSGTSWTIKFKNSDYYLGLKTTKDNGKVQVLADPQTFTASEKNSVIKLSPGGSSVLEKNTNGTQFGNYQNTQNGAWLEPVGSAKTLESISVSGSMTKTEYTTAEDWDPSGLTVTAHYDDESTEDVTSSSTWSYAPAKPAEGVTSVVATATYSKKEASSTAQSVTVTKVEPPSQITINHSDVDKSGTSYATRDWTSDNISGTTLSAINSGGYFQFQKTSGANACYIANSDAVPGPITKIQITKKGSSATTNLSIFFDKVKITSKPSEGAVSESASNNVWTWNVNKDNEFTYFYIVNGADDTKYFDDIVITYEKVTLVDPTGIKLDDASDIEMDTYGYGNRKLYATVEPYNANNKTVTWGTSNPNIVTISEGVLTPKGVGSAIVYGTTCNYVDDVTTPDLKVSVSVTISQAQYKKATFIPTSKDSLISADDYLLTGSASVSSTGSFITEKSAIQLGESKNAIFTISGYEGMKISGIDLVMSSNGDSGTGSLEVTIGGETIYEIGSAPFSDPSWNGAYCANAVNLFKSFSDSYIVGDDEDIVFEFNTSIKSLYIYSVAIRYLDASLEQWCQSFLDDYVCDPQGITRPSTDDWDDFGVEFIFLDDDLQELARNTTAKEDGNVIEKAMYKYDYIIGKYGDLEDPTTGAKLYDNYIERTPIQMSLIRTPNILGANENDSVTLIVVVAVISLTAVGAFFYIRRRRQHN